MGILRLFLALSVVNVHGSMGFPLLAGDLAVQTFFMISGFYMALVLNEKYSSGKAGYIDFIVSRSLRIFPSYFLVVLMTIMLLLAGGLYYGEVEGPLQLWMLNWAQFDWYSKLFLVFSHLALIGQDAYLFLGLDEKGGLYFDPDFHANHNEFLNFMLMPQAWTLSMELCFYLLAPLLVRRSVLMLGMIIVASLAVRIALAFWLGWIGDPWNHRFFPSELALFLCGSVSYRIYHVMRTGKMDAKSWYLWVALGAAAGCALLVNRLPGGIETWLNIGFVVAVLSALPFLFKLTKSWSIDRHIGELSYPVYLSHMMVIWLFVLMEVQEGLERSIGIILVTLILSFTLYWNIDRKVDIFRHNFRMTKAVDLHDSNIQQT